MKQTPPKTETIRSLYLPWLALGLVVLYVISTFIPHPPKSSYHVDQFGQLPVLNGGRIKPLDTVARTSLIMISGKQSLHTESGPKTATEWLMDTLFAPARSDSYEIFQIDDPDVLGLLGIQQTIQRRFSFDELRLSLSEIETQAERANQNKPEERSRFESSILVLHERLMLYHRLQNTLQPEDLTDVAQYYQENSDKLAIGLSHHIRGGASVPPALKESAEFLQRTEFLSQMAEFFPVPQVDNNKGILWTSVGDALLHRLQISELDPVVTNYARLGDAYRKNDSAVFNSTLDALQTLLQSTSPEAATHTGIEFLFNRTAPFYTSIMIYVVVFLLAFFFLLFNKESLHQIASTLLIASFVVHTVGLFSRMWIQGRPPVTNLYSSAIFVGWVSVLLGILLERIFRRGIGTIVSSFIGFTTLIIAHNLASQGDTMEMMRAVLDSNFWLATHVITVTVGYSSTFVSGVIATVYLVRRLWDPNWKKNSADVLFQMVYGVVCFSTFFSFLGTILGGIWADQSWGRFWGWDPKENGALMIVLWNVFILHARLSKSFDQKSIMIMAVFGNIITALSWFGVNMLGIGLHSYGFMEKAFFWLMLFIATQIVVMSLGWLPEPARKHHKDPPQ